MNSKRAFEIERELHGECRRKRYIEHGSEPRDEIMEVCYQAYAAVQAYRMTLKKEEARRAGIPSEQLK